MKHSYCWNLNSGDRQPKILLLQWTQSGPRKNQDENNLQIPSVHGHNSEKKNFGNHNSRHCNFLFPSLNILLLYVIPSCGTSCKRMWVINVVQEVNPGFSSFGYLVWSQQVFLNTLVNIMLDGFCPRPLPRPILGVTLAHPINIHTAPFLLLTARDVTLPRKTFSVS